MENIDSHLEQDTQHEEILRDDLSCAHWLCHRFKMDDLVWNHISARFETDYLITPGDLMWDMIEPQDLVRSSGNITANVIHQAIYESRPDIKAIVHLHTPAVVAVSCLEMGFIPLSQDGAKFGPGSISYHKWEGISDDTEEQKSIQESLGSTALNLIMHNHGACCMGDSVGAAWVRAWYLEKCCRL